MFKRIRGLFTWGRIWAALVWLVKKVYHGYENSGGDPGEEAAAALITEKTPRDEFGSVR